MQALLFALQHYALLGMVLLAAWGVGHLALGCVGRSAPLATGLTTPFAVVFGLGMAICALQALAVFGWLTVHAVGTLWVLGLLAACHQLVHMRRRAPAPASTWPAAGFGDRIALACLALALLSVLPRPLGPPLAWDELMYHLPHAQQWAETGRLQVNPWLRYPWFPYNFDLLYAAALLFGNDILPHLFHAAAGWLTAWLVYALGARHASRIVGASAAILWLLLTKGEYDNAYVDMGVAMFVLAAAIAFVHWRSGGRQRTWLAASAFLLGVAVGSKYQALGLLPFFAIALLRHDRRASTLLIATASLALPCAYWYARNAIATGDPFNPIGGPLFGFTDWDAADHQGQFADLRRNAGRPSWLLWPALLAPWLPALRQSAATRGAIWLCGWMLLVWLVSSRYPRYLIPAYPLLALLSVASVLHMLARVPTLQRAQAHPVARGAAWLLVIAVAVAAMAGFHKQSKGIAATAEARNAMLRDKVRGYGIWEHLRAHPIGRIYQLGVEDSLYYAPQPVWGEVFGPWRYRDVQNLPAQQMHRKLSSQHFDALVVDTERVPGLVTQPAFGDWFELLRSDGSVQLYRLRTPVAP
ncbi:hypothetical protein LJR039_002567 [Pseudorhodoferax sp. LjRoot39]|uniref:ArnT family glycosyltransferase n=1 Tax=Pseudorhodoferax sp. LjRoot39 TaxID=3342328 RepID=UPI003ECC31CD